MTFDPDYFVTTAIADGRFTRAHMSKVNPCSNIAIDYAASVLKAARRDRLVEVAGLKIEVEDLDDFQYFYIGDVEVTASAWNAALLELLEKRFREAFTAQGHAIS
jgi:hypothetical protein